MIHVNGWEQPFTFNNTELKLRFVSRIEFIRSQLSSSAHVSGVTGYRR